MARMEDTFVKCPYYLWEEGLVLCCELQGDLVSAPLHFRSKELRREYERKHCKKEWERCPLASALNSHFGY